MEDGRGETWKSEVEGFETSYGKRYHTTYNTPCILLAIEGGFIEYNIFYCESFLASFSIQSFQKQSAYLV